MTYIDT